MYHIPLRQLPLIKKYLDSFQNTLNKIGKATIQKTFPGVTCIT